MCLTKLHRKFVNEINFFLPNSKNLNSKLNRQRTNFREFSMLGRIMASDSSSDHRQKNCVMTLKKNNQKQLF